MFNNFLTSFPFKSLLHLKLQHLRGRLVSDVPLIVSLTIRGSIYVFYILGVIFYIFKGQLGYNFCCNKRSTISKDLLLKGNCNWFNLISNYGLLYVNCDDVYFCKLWRLTRYGKLFMICWFNLVLICLCCQKMSKGEIVSLFLASLTQKIKIRFIRRYIYLPYVIKFYISLCILSYHS